MYLFNSIISIQFQFQFSYFKTSDGESIIKLGFRATGITNAIANARQGNKPSLDPYSN